MKAMLAVPLLLAPWALAQDAPEKPAPDPAATAWPQFRGPFARGIADGYATPVEWSVKQSKNIAWRTKVPGLAHSSPIVWGDRIWVTTSVPASGDAELKVGLYGSITPVEDEPPQSFAVVCLDRDTGKVLWQKIAWHGVPKIKRHPKGSFAASTPATDGEHVVAFFGTEGLYAFDVDGELLWQKEFGVLDSGFYTMPKAQWGFASSPVIHDGRVFIQCDVQEGSFVAALDVKTGDEVWRTPRDEVPTWGSPTVDVGPTRSQLVVNGYKHLGGYDLATGKELWQLADGGDIPVPTPVVAGDLVYVTNGHGRMSPLIAIARLAEGTLSFDADESGHVAWCDQRSGNYMQTPIVVGDELFCSRDNGSLSCYDAKTGERKNRTRLLGGEVGFTASPVAADGKLYFTSEEGEVCVLRASHELELLATNELGETCMATPAISRGVLYFRTRGHVVAVRAM